MISLAIGADALIVLRSFVSAARLSLGAVAMYSSTVFAGVFVAGGRFVKVFLRGFGVTFRVGTRPPYSASHGREESIVPAPSPMAASGDRVGGAHALSGDRCRVHARRHVAFA